MGSVLAAIVSMTAATAAVDVLILTDWA